MQLVLRMIDRRSTAPMLRLLPGRYQFGRARDCQVRFHQRAVSWHHFAVTVGPAGATVCDQGSRHGTVVNGRTVSGEQALRDRDRLSVADSTFLVGLLRDEIDFGSACLTVPLEGHGPPVHIPAPPIAETVHRACGIAASIYIDGTGRWLGGDQYELEKALDVFLNGAGYLATVEDEGAEWGIDLVLHAVPDVPQWVWRLTTWLQNWPVPAGTALSVAVYPAHGGVQHQRIELHGRAPSCT